MQTCPTLERLVLDLHKNREIANKHLANLRYANKRIGVLEDRIKNLELDLEAEREVKRLTNRGNNE